MKLKAEYPRYSICEVAKELGRRWNVMATGVKQCYLQMAEEGRWKYGQDMATYCQGSNPSAADPEVTSSTSTKGDEQQPRTRRSGLGDGGIACQSSTNPDGPIASTNSHDEPADCSLSPPNKRHSERSTRTPNWAGIVSDGSDRCTHERRAVRAMRAGMRAPSSSASSG